MVKHLLIIFLYSFISDSVFAIKDCPGDMVLWRQPGSNYSDCVCPTGQSMVTNLKDINLHTFGKCSESFIPVSKTWATDISTLIYWADADDPYGNGYKAASSSTVSSLVNKSGGSAVAIQSGTYDTYNSRVAINTSSANHSSVLTLTANTARTYFLVFSTPVLSNSYSFIDNGSNYSITYTPGSIKYSNGSCSISATSPSPSIANLNQIIVVNDNSPSPGNSASVALINNGSGYNNNYTTSAGYVARLTGSGCTTPASLYLNSYFNGYLNELLIYNSSLTDAQIAQVLAMLNQKWQVF